MLTVAAFALLGWMMGLGSLYWVGWLAVAGLLVYEHSLVLAGRSLAARRGVLQRQRLHRGDPASLAVIAGLHGVSDVLDGADKARFVGAMFSRIAAPLRPDEQRS